MRILFEGFNRNGLQIRIQRKELYFGGWVGGRSPVDFPLVIAVAFSTSIFGPNFAVIFWEIVTISPKNWLFFYIP